ncbi:serine/threonine-protein kinase [Streptomyces tirandamycinicus]|uniref:serine/threonine-protein kinase n=1 Tax=Streptomyces tirandamycinicus TaxID=2174846 RepID=UPI002271BA47|nr:serine/threonine-protein kinase [Streptomyces tirandamycinicus]MCY0983821.1 protein kinase [Streptomyces tirandamycinicus]
MSDGEPGRRVIDGRFELEARLGGGGMGMVWRARDLVLHRAVALKEVRPPDPGLAEYDPEGAAMLRARVLREARALARVDHPNVVTIHHVVDGGEHTYPWLVMELVTGGSLHDRLEKGPLAPTEAARIGREVLAALRAAHAAGIQHRDVKPANVLMRPDGRPVLTDFGIAAIRESTALTATGSIIGTPDYMAPERISGDEGGPGSDLWSLAMMLYVAVEGRHPLRRGSTLATLAALLSEELPPPFQAGPLTGFLNATLVKDPAVRADADTADRMLAEAAEGRDSAPGAPSAQTPPTSPSAQTSPTPPTGSPSSRPSPSSPVSPPSVPTAPAGAGGTTSYRLSPPPGQTAAPAGAPAGFGPPMGFGPSVPRDSVPGPAGPPTPYPAGPTRQTPPGPGGRTKGRIAIAASAVATVLAGVLVWTMLPDGGDKGGGTAANPPGSSSPGSSSTATKGATPAPPEAAPSASAPAPQADAKTDLLTPDGIRTAVKEIKAATGTDRAADFSVYPDYVSAEIMLKGSETKYDSYTYRPGQGVQKGIISGSLIGGDRPFSLDDFDWDVLPALLKRAEKDLNVKQPTMRYVLVSPPDDTFGTPLGLAVYRVDDHVVGFLEADLKGKVTRVEPAED